MPSTSLLHDGAVLQQASQGQGAINQESDLPGQRAGVVRAGLLGQLGQPRLTPPSVLHSDGPGLRVQVRFDRRADKRASEEAVPFEGVRQRVKVSDELLTRAAPGSCGGVL
ncbi:hypothetical protein GCM10010206_60120 [Streptomyces cinerochromogenes]|nr:hypothetical protein GCM10010206_60120 [Streptomyces cinerochromogenes]